MKPGYQTTEFWCAAIATILGLINQSGYLGHPLPVDHIMSITAPVITYIVTRSATKAVAQFLDVKPVDPKKLNE